MAPTPDPDPPLVKTTYLVQQAQQGDRAALDNLFARYAARVRRIVALRLGKRLSQFTDADDVAQEALLRIFQKLDRFEHRSEGSFRNWLARCVENTIVDHVRHERAKKRGEDKVRRFGDWREESLVPLIFPAKGPTPSHIASTAELEERVEEKLLELPQHHREVIVLRDLCELSYEEVAEAMGFEKTVTARVAHSRAMDKLRLALEAC